MVALISTFVNFKIFTMIDRFSLHDLISLISDYTFIKIFVTKIHRSKFEVSESCWITNEELYSIYPTD